NELIICALLRLLFASHQQNRRLNIFCFKCDWEDERVNVTECDFSGGVWVNGWKGGVAGAEFRGGVTFSQWLGCLINVCSSLQSLLCLFERNIVEQHKIQGNLSYLYAQNDVSV